MARRKKPKPRKKALHRRAKRVSRTTYGQRECDWCTSPYVAVRDNQRYCRKQCQQAFYNWCKARSVLILDAGIKWRRERTGEAFALLTQEIDVALHELRRKQDEARRKAGMEAKGDLL